ATVVAERRGAFFAEAAAVDLAAADLTEAAAVDLAAAVRHEAAFLERAAAEGRIRRDVGDDEAHARRRGGLAAVGVTATAEAHAVGVGHARLDGAVDERAHLFGVEVAHRSGRGHHLAAELAELAVAAALEAELEVGGAE